MSTTWRPTPATLAAGLLAVVCAACADAGFADPGHDASPDTDTDTDTDGDSDGDTDGDSDGDSDTDTDGDSDTDTDADTDTDTDTDGDTDADCDLNVAESFDGNTLPDGWEIEDAEGDAYDYTWVWSDSDNTTGGSGGYWWVNGAFAVAFDDSLISAPYAPGDCSDISLTFNQDFAKSGSDDFGFVQIQINGGAWQTLTTLLASTTTPGSIDLSSYLTESTTEFRVRFRYVGNNDQSWKMDDFELVGAP